MTNKRSPKVGDKLCYRKQTLEDLRGYYKYALDKCGGRVEFMELNYPVLSYVHVTPKPVFTVLHINHDVLMLRVGDKRGDFLYVDPWEFDSDWEIVDDK